MKKSKNKILRKVNKQSGVILLDAVVTLILMGIVLGGSAMVLAMNSKQQREANIHNLVLKAIRQDLNDSNSGGMTGGCVAGTKTSTAKPLTLLTDSSSGSTQSSPGVTGASSYTVNEVVKNCVYETTTINITGFTPIDITIPRVNYTINDNKIVGTMVIGDEITN